MILSEGLHLWRQSSKDHHPELCNTASKSHTGDVKSYLSSHAVADPESKFSGGKRFKWGPVLQGSSRIQKFQEIPFKDFKGF